MNETAVCEVCGREYDLSERAHVMRKGKIHTIRDIEVSGATIKGLCKNCLLAAIYGSLVAKYSEIPEVDQYAGDRFIVLSRTVDDEEDGGEEKYNNVSIK